MNEIARNYNDPLTNRSLNNQSQSHLSKFKKETKKPDKKKKSQK